jgi:2-keto-4-pentenoate hydratase/2-oxohepta-3-ene-1,7-dioic acid hydratase in catechol pathway
VNLNSEIGRFVIDGQNVIGMIDGEHVRILSEDDNLREVLAELPASANVIGRKVLLSKTKYLPALDPDARVFAVAVNYPAHGKEASVSPPPRPLLFYKAPSNFVAHGGTLDSHPELTQKFDYEGEIGVVIGKPCFKVSRENAFDYVAGICPINDGSARDLTVMHAGEIRWVDWTAAKGLESASAIGPVITYGTEVTNMLRNQEFTFVTRLNGEVVQQGNMKDMVFNVADLIATLSSYMTLMPGDVIATGTPSGIGMARNRFLQTGDKLEVQIGDFRPLQVNVK